MGALSSFQESGSTKADIAQICNNGPQPMCTPDACIYILFSFADSPSHAHDESSLKHGDYSCMGDVMVEGDTFTYPYYWDSGDVACAVKIQHPITPSKNYFEHKILSRGVICAITIGMVGRDYPLDRQPGWDEEGIGYHADDGKVFNEDGLGALFGPTCTTGDRMGCGIVFEGDLSSEYVKVFFTKNGQQVGDFVEFRRPESGLHPFMGFSSRGEQFQYLGSWHHLPGPQEHVHDSKESKLNPNILFRKLIIFITC